MTPTNSAVSDRVAPPLVITFAPNQRPDDWHARFVAGEASSEWPYGLNLQRERFNVEPYVRERPTPQAVLRFMANAAINATRLRSPRREAPGHAFSWDENLAIRSLISHPDHAQVSGLIWATQAPDSYTGAVKRALSRIALRRVDGIFVSSSAQVESGRRWLGDSSIPIVHIPMAVSVDFFRPTPYAAEPFVFSMGNDKHRDPALLAKAMGLVIEANPAAQVLVQTNQPELFPSAVETVNFLSTVDVLNCYKKASVVAIATRPNDHVSGITVALEAMASGRPVVMSEAPGLSDYIEDGKTGFLVDRGDAGLFAQRVNSILTDPSLGLTMGLEARARVESKFSLQIMNSAISDFIASIAAR